MANPIQFYFDFASPYGYLAATLQTLTQAVNLGFGGPEHLVASLVPAIAKLNNTPFPPKS